MAGAGKEWLKQSDEKRAAKYQEIRDKRIGEIRKGNITHEYGLRSDEAQRAEKVQSAESEKERGFRKGESELDRKNRLEVEANKPINLSQGETAWNREGKLIARGDPKTFAPNAASQAAKEYEETKVYRRGKGGERGAATTMKELADEWAEQAYVDTVTTDDLGNQIKTKKRNPNFPGLTEYQNQSVTDEYQLEPNSIDQIRRDPARLWQMFQSQPEFSQPGGRENALITMKREHPWWTPDMEEGVAGQAKEAAGRTEIPAEPANVPGTPIQTGQSGGWSPAAGGGGGGGAPAEIGDPTITQGYLGQSMNPEQLAALKAQYGR
jgi:hypothetical protein